MAEGNSSVKMGSHYILYKQASKEIARRLSLLSPGWLEQQGCEAVISTLMQIYAGVDCHPCAYPRSKRGGVVVVLLAGKAPA